MYCRCHEYSHHPFRENPITPDRLYKVLTMAIWPTDDSATSKEADAARQIAIRFLVAVQPVDLPQLQEVMAKIMGVATVKPGALVKLLEIYQEATKRNPILPPPNIGQPKTVAKPAAKPAPKPASRRAPKAAPPPPSRQGGATKPPPGRPKSQDAPEDEDRRAPRPREACRSCDGKGYRIKVDKENVMKETRVTCSKCGGTGREPPPSTGKGRGFRRGPHVKETEEEEDINQKADNFLRRHGLNRWGF